VFVGFICWVEIRIPYLNHFVGCFQPGWWIRIDLEMGFFFACFVWIKFERKFVDAAVC